MTANACTVLELRLPAGQGAGLHVHQHEEEIVFVQDGSCTVGHVDQSWELGTGSWVVFPKQTAHFFHNTAAQPVVPADRFARPVITIMPLSSLLRFTLATSRTSCFLVSGVLTA
jgi:oxalate decarboxylase/phosphoglucose isomerase-like protein (cupin superfamily)